MLLTRCCKRGVVDEVLCVVDEVLCGVDEVL